MSSVSKSYEIELDKDDRELLEKAIAKCKKIAHDCCIEGLAVFDVSVFECLCDDYESNHGHLAAHIDIQE